MTAWLRAFREAVASFDLSLTPNWPEQSTLRDDAAALASYWQAVEGDIRVAMRRYNPNPATPAD